MGKKKKTMNYKKIIETAKKQKTTMKNSEWAKLTTYMKDNDIVCHFSVSCNKGNVTIWKA